ncbi:DUF2190 family protein [Galactobacter valiniphilus]|uniref:DUF2190 family protein n=1 Tax=Galactobacter valiniphilus TaxID=2676122 RepID=UPI0037363E82
MAKNQRYSEAKHISLPAPYDIESGAPVAVGGFKGIALIDAKKDAPVTVWLDGSWDVTVTGQVKPGDTVYITPAGVLNTTAASNQPWGLALGTKAAAAGVVEVAPLGKTVPTA